MKKMSVSTGVIILEDGRNEICLTVSSEDSAIHTGISASLARILARTMLDLADMLDQPKPTNKE